MVKANSLEKGLQDGWTRATFVLRKDYLSKLKGVSYWERKKMKEVIDEALGSYLKGKRIKSLIPVEGLISEVERKARKEEETPEEKVEAGTRAKEETLE